MHAHVPLNLIQHVELCAILISFQQTNLIGGISDDSINQMLTVFYEAEFLLCRI